MLTTITPRANYPGLESEIYSLPLGRPNKQIRLQPVIINNLDRIFNSFARDQAISKNARGYPQIASLTTPDFD